VSYSYANKLRTGLSVQEPSASDWTESYGYDSAKRLTSLTSPAGAFGYVYTCGCGCPGGCLVKKITLPNGAYITNNFDGMARMMDTTLKNSGNTSLDSRAYLYNVGSQRTKETRFDGSYVDFTYDAIGQLKSALGKESGGSTRLHEQYGYAYDAAGNLNYRTNNALIQTFNVNNKNELTTGTRSGTMTVAGTTSSNATSVTVNTLSATRYGDNTFASKCQSSLLTLLVSPVRPLARKIHTRVRGSGIWRSKMPGFIGCVAGPWRRDFRTDCHKVKGSVLDLLTSSDSSLLSILAGERRINKSRTDPFTFFCCHETFGA
jgi:hypothetical protein